MFLNNQQVAEDIKSEIKTFLETNDNENTTTQNQWDAPKSSSKKEVYSNTILPQEIRKTLKDNLTLHLKQLEKEEEKNPKLLEGKKS